MSNPWGGSVQRYTLAGLRVRWYLGPRFVMESVSIMGMIFAMTQGPQKNFPDFSFSYDADCPPFWWRS